MMLAFYYIDPSARKNNCGCGSPWPQHIQAGNLAFVGMFRGDRISMLDRISSEMRFFFFKQS